MSLERRTPLDGGGFAIIVDGYPRELSMPFTRSRKTEERILLERAEQQYNCWLEWEGPWSTPNGHLGKKAPAKETVQEIVKKIIEDAQAIPAPDASTEFASTEPANDGQTPISPQLSVASNVVALPSVPAADPLIHRMVRPCSQQPTYRMQFDGDGYKDAWLIMVDPVTGSPGNAFAWTHTEWLDTSDKYEEGGMWCQIDSKWQYRGTLYSQSDGFWYMNSDLLPQLPVTLTVMEIHHE